MKKHEKIYTIYPPSTKAPDLIPEESKPATEAPLTEPTYLDDEPDNALLKFWRTIHHLYKGA